MSSTPNATEPGADVVVFRLFVPLPADIYDALCDRALVEGVLLADVARSALRSHLGLDGRPS